MGLGQRVRITRPPPGKKEWEDQKATVVTLVPEAKHPLEYKIRLDSDGSEHNVPENCLEPLKIQEEIGDGPFRYLLVNNLMYCTEHRLEVCGSCGVDHRMTNYQAELPECDDLSVVDRLLEGMRHVGAPPRQAPSKTSKSKTPQANTAVFRPVVNEHLISIEQGLNPSNMDPWPPGLPTYQAAEAATEFSAEESLIPEFAKLPVRRVRENVVIAARRWDHVLSDRMSNSNEPMPRLLLQDKAQTQVLSLDLVPPVRMRLIRGRPVPVFVVRWAHALATNMQDALAVMGTMERNTKMGEIPVLPDEIELMAELLKKNGELLDQSFVRSVEKYPQILAVSILTPIPEASQISFYESLGAYCYQCGTSGCATQKCSRCMLVKYCSRECQRKNWKFHKASCRQR